MNFGPLNQPWYAKPAWATNELHWKAAVREIATLLGEINPYPIQVQSMTKIYETPFTTSGYFADVWTLTIEDIDCRITHNAGSWKAETYFFYKHKMKSREEAIEWLKTVGVPSELSRTYDPYQPRTHFGVYGPHETRPERPSRPQPRGPVEILE